MFKSARIGTRLCVGFGIVLFLLVLTGAIGLWNIRSISEKSVTLLQTEPEISEHAAMARIHIGAMRQYEKDSFINMASKEKVTKYLGQWNEAKEKASAELKGLKKFDLSQKDRDLLKTIEGELATYLNGAGKVFGMISKGDLKKPEEANDAIDPYKEAVRKIEQAATSMSVHSFKRLEEGQKQIRAQAGQALWIVLLIALFSVLLGLAASTLVTRSITGPLKKVVHGLKKGAEEVAAASSQVSSSSQSLAEGTSEQAASLEETSSSLEEMASMTKQNAENANQADGLMKGANQVVEGANASMKQLTRSMEEITKASEETSKIIKTIDEIAFQTNLLALNAAVEAARAGEAGAGFAVVAGEVRNLAMRAADAAKNTANLIEGTVKKVKDGSQLVIIANEAFGKVAESSAKVGGLVAEIAAASNEQGSGIEQVNKAVAEMDKVVQQNASNAEESASASETMNSQAQQLMHFVDDIAALVGGATGGAGLNRQPTKVKSTKAVLTQHRTKAASSLPAGKELRPEQLIPLEAQEQDFKDF